MRFKMQLPNFATCQSSSRQGAGKDYENIGEGVDIDGGINVEILFS